MDSTEQALADAIARFEAGMQNLVADMVSTIARQFDEAMERAFARNQAVRLMAALPPPPTTLLATALPLGVNLPPPPVKLKTADPPPELVATGWRWCDGSGKKLRHMWNLHTTALRLYPRPTRRREMSLPVERCPWHRTGSDKVQEIVRKAKERYRL